MKKTLFMMGLVGLFSCEGTFLNPKPCYTCMETTLVTIVEPAGDQTTSSIDRSFDVCGSTDVASTRKTGNSRTESTVSGYTTITQLTTDCVAKK